MSNSLPNRHSIWSQQPKARCMASSWSTVRSNSVTTNRTESIISFLTTDAGTQWLASARQIAVEIGTDDHEEHGGAVGDTPQPTAEHRSNQRSVDGAPDVR